jgi:hypothetical protein
MSNDGDIYVHPERFPKNAPGAFYTLGSVAEDGTWCGQCLACTIPESEAPTLLAPLTDENSDTYFIRQPETADEIEQACSAVEVCCVDAIRYGGKELDIIERLGSDHCDFAVLYGIGPRHRVRNTRRHWWRFWK